jgi:hypothetical protein
VKDINNNFEVIAKGFLDPKDRFVQFLSQRHICMYYWTICIGG